MNYNVYYEIKVGSRLIKDTMVVEATNKKRAVEHAKETLEDRHNQGRDEGRVTLLECYVVVND